MANPYADIVAEEEKRQSAPATPAAAAAPPAASTNPYGEIVSNEAEEARKAREALAGSRQRVDNPEPKKPEIEFKDAPTIFDMPLPGLKGMPGLKEGDQGVSLGSLLSLRLGPLSTDNPKSRQEIITKSLPDAVAKNDKFGNPGIEYKGKFYYTARPGEIDKMDVGRAVGMTAVAAPAAALAPISGPGAVIAGGLLNAGQSIGEDVVAKASGAESQPTVDLPKAGIAGLFGMISPALGPVVREAATAGYRGVARFVPMFFGTGVPTARGARILGNAGFTAEQIAAFTPEIRERIQAAANKNFGSADTTNAAYREAVGNEFGVPQTKGEIGGDATQITKEKNLRGGQYGPNAQSTMGQQVADRNTQLNAAQQEIVSQAGGGGPPLTSGEAGEVLAGQQRNAQTAYQVGTVRPAYERATNEAAVVAAGGTRRADIAAFQGMPQVVAQALDAPGPGRLIVNPAIADIAPHTANMVNQIRDWSRPGLGGNVPVTTSQVSWDAVDKLRRQLDQSAQAAAEAAAAGRGSATDAAAARRVLNAFDSQFTPNNPLLRDARAHAEAGFRFFQPGDQQSPLTQNLLEKFNRPASSLPGTEVTDKLFGADLKSGKALDTVQHLVALHPPGSPGHLAMAQESLRRLFADPDDARRALTPAKIVQNIDDALGDRQGPVYRSLLTDDQIAELRRFRDLNQNLAEAGRLNNPSGSGHVAVAAGRSAAQKALGAGIGGWIGSILGTTGKVVGAATGAAAGKLTGGYAGEIAAQRAVHPAPGAVYGKSSTPFIAGGAAAVPAEREAGTNDEGLLSGSPVDRLWRGILAP
jgi:hypothetical protein